MQIRTVHQLSRAGLARGAAELFIDAGTGFLALAGSAGRRLLTGPRLYRQTASYTSLIGGETEVSLSPPADTDYGIWIVFKNGSPLADSGYTMTSTLITLSSGLALGDVIRVVYQSRSA